MVKSLPRTLNLALVDRHLYSERNSLYRILRAKELDCLEIKPRELREAVYLEMHNKTRLKHKVNSKPACLEQISLKEVKDKQLGLYLETKHKIPHNNSQVLKPHYLVETQLLDQPRLKLHKIREVYSGTILIKYKIKDKASSETSNLRLRLAILKLNKILVDCSVDSSNNNNNKTLEGSLVELPIKIMRHHQEDYSAIMLSNLRTKGYLETNNRTRDYLVGSKIIREVCLVKGMLSSLSSNSRSKTSQVSLV